MEVLSWSTRHHNNQIVPPLTIGLEHTEWVEERARERERERVRVRVRERERESEKVRKEREMMMSKMNKA